MQVRSVATAVAMMILLGAGCSTESTVTDGPPPRSDVSIDAEDRSHVDSIRVPDEAMAGNPHESSFGTVQPDGTYCGAFCSENH